MPPKKSAIMTFPKYIMVIEKNETPDAHFHAIVVDDTIRDSEKFCQKLRPHIVKAYKMYNHTETGKSKLRPKKFMLDNYFIPSGSRQVWKIPHQQQPFKILKKTSYHRKGSFAMAPSAASTEENVFAPIYHSFNYGRNTSLHYQPTDADSADATELKNWKLDSQRKTWVPVTYVLNKTVANANLTQTAADPANFSSKVNEAPVLHLIGV